MNTNSALLNCFGLALSIAKKQAWSGMAWKPGMEGGGGGGRGGSTTAAAAKRWILGSLFDTGRCDMFLFFIFSVRWLKYYFNEFSYRRHKTPDYGKWTGTYITLFNTNWALKASFYYKPHSPNHTHTFIQGTCLTFTLGDTRLFSILTSLSVDDPFHPLSQTFAPKWWQHKAHCSFLIHLKSQLQKHFFWFFHYILIYSLRFSINM